jgi:hypothetical protein
MAKRHFNTLKDWEEMRIGDELHRVLADDIDGRIDAGVNNCAIAIDLWDDRPPTCSRRPHVMSKAHTYHVSVWPEPGKRLDFNFTNDAALQITEAANSKPPVSVAGLGYDLRLKNVETFKPKTPRDYERDRRAREAKKVEYQTVIQKWVNDGQRGEPPGKPSVLTGGHHIMPEREAVMREYHLPHVNPHEEMMKRREAERRKKEWEREKRERAAKAAKAAKRDGQDRRP